MLGCGMLIIYERDRRVEECYGQAVAAIDSTSLCLAHVYITFLSTMLAVSYKLHPLVAFRACTCMEHSSLAGLQYVGDAICTNEHSKCVHKQSINQIFGLYIR